MNKGSNKHLGNPAHLVPALIAVIKMVRSALLRLLIHFLTTALSHRPEVQKSTVWRDLSITCGKTPRSSVLFFVVFFLFWPVIRGFGLYNLKECGMCVCGKLWQGEKGGIGD